MRSIQLPVCFFFCLIWFTGFSLVDCIVSRDHVPAVVSTLWNILMILQPPRLQRGGFSVGLLCCVGADGIVSCLQNEVVPGFQQVHLIAAGAHRTDDLQAEVARILAGQCEGIIFG